MENEKELKKWLDTKFYKATRANLGNQLVIVLYGLTIGQIALRVGTIISIEPDFFESIDRYPSFYTQLALAMFIVVLSWIGWHKSKARANFIGVNSVFDHQFIILLLEIFLVVCYYCIVAGAGIGGNVSSEKDLDTLYAKTKNDSRNEIFWTMMIFACYILWDFCTKIFKPELKKIEPVTGTASYKKTLAYHWCEWLKRAWPGILCFLASLFLLIRVKPSDSQEKAMIMDACLISLFFVFRGFKQELKKKYTVNVDHKSYERIKEKYKKEDNCFPMEIIDRRFKIKILFIKILPPLLTIIFFIWYLRRK